MTSLWREAAEEAGLVPVRAAGAVGDGFGKRQDQAVEAGGRFQIHRLVQIVGGRVVAFFQPGLRDLLLGRSFLIAELSSPARGRRGE